MRTIIYKQVWADEVIVMIMRLLRVSSSLLRAERIKRKVYKAWVEARSDIFNYIELFYNPKRHHGNNGRLSPVEHEKQYFEKLLSVKRTKGIP